MMFYVYAIPPVLGPAFVAWALATRRLSDGLRRATMAATILLACGVWTLFRTDGVMGGAGAQLAWRWTKTAEERLLAQADDEVRPLPDPPATAEVPKEPAAPTARTGGEAAPVPSPPAGDQDEATRFGIAENGAGGPVIDGHPVGCCGSHQEGR